MEPNENKEPKVDPIDEIVAKINKTVESKLDVQMDAVQKKLDSMKTPEPKEPEPKMEWDEDDDDDGYVTMKGLKTVIERTLEEAQKSSKNITQQALSESINKSAMDDKAFNDFPELNQHSQRYDGEFASAVTNEIGNRVGRGRSRDDVDLLYDAAATVRATNPKFAQNLLDKVKEEQRVNANLQAGFNAGGGKKVVTSKPTDYQRAFADRVGLTQEKLEAHLKKQVKK